MPRFSKELLSQYLRTGCERQLRLSLYPDTLAYRAQREAERMPREFKDRYALAQITQAGVTYQEAKVRDLETAFTGANLVGEQDPHTGVYEKALLASLIGRARPNTFLIEAEFEITDTFRATIGVDGITDLVGEALTFACVRPDVIEVITPGSTEVAIDPAGSIVELPPDDPRVVLRVLDIKLAEEPSAHYFAEVVYYSMALASWLLDNGLADRFVVHGQPAVWPGSHEASTLARRRGELLHQGIIPTYDQLREFMRADLRLAEVEAFVPRIRRVLAVDVPRVLATADWRDLDWFVDSRCMGCDYRGYAWPGGDPPDAEHCWPMAERTEHLSRIPFMTRGASGVLRDGNVTTVGTLAVVDPADDVLHQHHALRAARAVLPLRARSLQRGITGIADHTGRPAGMPEYVDLHVYLTVDFDVTSAITFAFGISGFWREPTPPGGGGAAATHAWDEQAFIVESCGLAVERRDLLRLLHRLQDMLDHSVQNQPAGVQTRFQLYLWDSLQFDHFTRVIGRHLPSILADRRIASLAWLFPADELVPDPRAVTREAPITLMGEVVRTHLAAAIPHHYGLLEVAAEYGYGYQPRAVHPYYRDPLSDQIPSERAQEVWRRVPEWRARMSGTEQVVREKLRALRSVTRRVERDMRGVLSRRAAATLRIGPPDYVPRLSTDGQLWYHFARLNNALEQYRVHQIRAMPPHEREARFNSARLTRRLTGREEADALAHFAVPPRAGLRVYELAATSVEVKLKVGDFNFALSPRNAPEFLDLYHQQVFQGTPAERPNNDGWRRTMDSVTQVTVRGLDRDRRLMLLEESARSWTTLDDVERFGTHTLPSGAVRRVDLSHDVMLDPTHTDYFTRKLRAALIEIRNPPLADINPIVARALGQVQGPRARRSVHTPPADFLWNASAMHQEVVQREVTGARRLLEARGVRLNDPQWDAWEGALTRRLHLIWGPPGTGKSRTMRAVVLGAVAVAHLQRRGLRILVCAGTYSAMDKVLEVTGDLAARLPDIPVEAFRVRSSYTEPNAAIPATPVVLAGGVVTPELMTLRGRLEQLGAITIVGATPEQTHNLMTAGGGSALQPLFDLVLIDEASQVDVAHAILPLCALAPSGAVILSGDHLQLDPIHKAKPPAGLEAMVGAVFNYFRIVHQIPESQLTINYRSNERIVGFSRRAGYGQRLVSHSPELTMDLAAPVPEGRPADWPDFLHWCPGWAQLLDPESPTVSFVYPDGRSSQWNPFEADAVAALLFLLHGRLCNQPRGERDPDGALRPITGAPYVPRQFWENGVGVVTPHRAQQGRIVSRLQQVFGGGAVDSRWIRDAVDTVERFQGQERDVIIASLALGDPDVIRTEEEFLMQLNRFNVMTSRPRTKLIVLVSQEVVDHLSNDAEIIAQSRLLKVFTESHCGQSAPLELGFIDEAGRLQPRRGHLRR